MTTIRTLVADAFRETGITPIDDEPTAAELDEGIRKLNALLRGLFGNELGEQLTTVNFGSAGLSNSYALDQDQASIINSIYVSPNLRLVFNIDTNYTLYLPPNPEDGTRLGVIDNGGNFATHTVTLNGNGRKIESAATLLLNTNSLNREWFYRADLGSWIRVTDLEANDVSPFPLEFDDLLTTALAFRINPRFGAKTGQELMDTLTRMRKQFRARYRQTVTKWSEAGLWRLTGGLLPPSNFKKGF